MAREYLKALRKGRGLTQREVAVRAHLSTSYYSEIESGRKQLNEKLAKGISEALGVSTAEVFGAKNPGQDLTAAGMENPEVGSKDKRAPEPPQTESQSTEDSSDLDAKRIEVLLSNGRVVRFHVDTNTAKIKQIIQAVEAS